MREIRAITALSIPELLQRLMTAFHCYVYEYEGNVMAVFGVDAYGECFLYFVPTDSLPLSFYREIKTFLYQQVRQYGNIHSVIMTENHFALRLAKYLGARLGRAYIDNGNEYMRFEVRLCV
jgi:hypothetical protein